MAYGGDSPDSMAIAALQQAVRRDGFTAEHAATFRNIIYSYFDASGRAELPWRDDYAPYHVLVSEIMLQQTQVSRVIDIYRAFVAAFPDFETLAAAPLGDILAAWQGLGYNRRAIALKKCAEAVVNNHGGVLPDDFDALRALPGIGAYTASAIRAFAFNQPVVLIETNVRTIFIHFFFPDRTDVHDSELLPLIEKARDTANPRRWYSALMDYGVMLKQRFPNPSRRSVHHTKQSRFEGSDRQIRGLILKALTAHGALTRAALASHIDRDAARIDRALGQLEREGFIVEDRGTFFIP